MEREEWRREGGTEGGRGNKGGSEKKEEEGF